MFTALRTANTSRCLIFFSDIGNSRVLPRQHNEKQKYCYIFSLADFESLTLKPCSRRRTRVKLARQANRVDNNASGIDGLRRPVAAVWYVQMFRCRRRRNRDSCIFYSTIYRRPHSDRHTAQPLPGCPHNRVKKDDGTSSTGYPLSAPHIA